MIIGYDIVNEMEVLKRYEEVLSIRSVDCDVTSIR